MYQGSCLCGAVKFEVETFLGPFELCHCRRCRKISGSAFMAAVTVSRKGFRFIEGEENIKIFDAPVIEAPPGYRSIFCNTCGSPVPDPTNDSPKFEIAAGAFDKDPTLNPDKHIYIEAKSSWFAITDDLPQMNKKELWIHRTKST